MIPNLRDVGETINIIHGEEILHEGVLFRGGTINGLFNKDELPSVNCILNLRNGIDNEFDGVNQIHTPRKYTNEVYETRNGNVRNWLNTAISSICKKDHFPLLVHCTGGKDRTGVFIALLLLAIGVKQECIIEDYLLSDGDTDIALIKQALTGIGDPSQYLYENTVIDFLRRQLTMAST